MNEYNEEDLAGIFPTLFAFIALACLFAAAFAAIAGSWDLVWKLIVAFAICSGIGQVLEKASRG